MTKRISRTEAVLSTIERIERLDPFVNAVVVRDFERARRDAQDAHGPLAGVPVTVKESFDVAGLPTTLGLRANATNVATRDSDVVRRLREAGAVVLGKTNVAAMIAGFATDNERYGRTSNPWDCARGVGGSSGGSAAAVAAGFARIEVGSDLGGSLRNPAHYCGVYAHKPTFGVVSMRGHGLPSMLLEPDMAVAGPLARSAEDLALALRVLSGGDARVLPMRRAPLRVAVWSDDPVSPVDEEIAVRILEVGARLASRGHVVDERARPSFDPPAYRAVYAALVGALTGAASSDDAYASFKDHARSLDANDDSRPAAFARALVSSHRTWVRHDQERRRWRDAWRTFFKDIDVLLCPVVGTCARPPDDPPPLGDVFWASLATLAYLPATVFPCGLSRSGLPIGVQAVGPEFGDATTIELARLASEDFGGFVPPPALVEWSRPCSEDELERRERGI